MEWEWRQKTGARKRSAKAVWGPQWERPSVRRFFSWKWGKVILLVAAMAACQTPVSVSNEWQIQPAEQGLAAAGSQPLPRTISAIVYDYPPEAELISFSCTRQQLLRGKLLLLDQAHPLPQDVPAPNTLSIAAYAGGNIPVRSLQLSSGIETMDALKSLFSALRRQNVTGLAVWEATISQAQQQAEKLEYARMLMRSVLPEDAAAQTVMLWNEPGAEEMLQEYTVELRFRRETSPDPRRPEMHADGQALLQQAWRHGFVRTHPDAGEHGPHRFRYVGRAHAMAMTYLDLSLQDYLLWLHEKGVLTIYNGGTPEYVIVCTALQNGRAVFRVPQNAQYEVSLDNIGYAVAACTLQM